VRRVYDPNHLEKRIAFQNICSGQRGIGMAAIVDVGKGPEWPIEP
jgi:hypothetical protein